MTPEKDIPVGTLCAMYGLNPNTLRTWERRYQFPSPNRGPGGHRTYVPADIALIGKIVDLMNSGLSPALAIEQARASAPRRKAASRTSSKEQKEFSNSVVAAIQAHDQAAVRSLSAQALRKFGYQSFIEDHAFPLLSQLGHNWEVTGRGVAAEHSFTMVVEGIILHHGQHLKVSPTAPTVTFACAPGEVHQLPLLHLANLAAEKKLVRPVVLAAGLPIEETLAASRAADARFIVLCATIPPASGDTRTWVKNCMDAGWADRLILAGPGFMRSRVYADYAVKAGAGDFNQTVELLKSLTS